MVQNLIFAVEFGYMGSNFDRMAISQGIMSETAGFNEAEVQNSFFDENNEDDDYDPFDL